MDNTVQEKVKLHLKSLQLKMTETYEKIIVANFSDEKLTEKFEELAEEFHKDDFDMRQIGLRGCVHNSICPEYIVACCNWCSGMGVWNPELRKEYERSKND
tara:strand:- start:15 stop:317 length:303 start_codon:yes stop_codon:yes gene_type:complete